MLSLVKNGLLLGRWGTKAEREGLPDDCIGVVPHFRVELLINSLGLVAILDEVCEFFLGLFSSGFSVL